MTPCGQRGFASTAAARTSAENQGIKSFVVLRNGLQPEYAWIGPVSFFMSRALQAITAGIVIVDRVG